MCMDPSDSMNVAPEVIDAVEVPLANVVTDSLNPLLEEMQGTLPGKKINSI